MVQKDYPVELFSFLFSPLLGMGTGLERAGGGNFDFFVRYDFESFIYGLFFCLRHDFCLAVLENKQWGIDGRISVLAGD